MGRQPRPMLVGFSPEGRFSLRSFSVKVTYLHRTSDRRVCVGAPRTQARHGILFCPEGKIRSDRQFSSARWSHKDGVCMCRHVDRQSEVIVDPCGIWNRGIGRISSTIARIYVSRRIEAHHRRKPCVGALRPLQVLGGEFCIRLWYSLYPTSEVGYLTRVTEPPQT